MQPGIGPKQVVSVFAVVLVLYLGAFYGIEHWRHRLGPWEVEFRVGTSGAPEVVVWQPKLRIEGIPIRFPGEHVEGGTHGEGRVRFDEPGRNPPFGEVIYEDLTQWPGVVTFNLFGHEIELLPRVLLINRRELEWASTRVVVLKPEEKPAKAPRPPKGGTRDRSSR